MRARVCLRAGLACVFVTLSAGPWLRGPSTGVTLYAQDEGGGGGAGGGGGGGGGGGDRNGLLGPRDLGAADPYGPVTPLEQIVEKLKLDKKTQAPQVQAILEQAAAEAAPVGQQMNQIRQRLLNANLHGLVDEIRAQTAAYETTATAMAGIEARAFAKISALARPDQQKNAAQTFAVLAGLFVPTSPGGASGGRPGGGR